MVKTTKKTKARSGKSKQARAKKLRSALTGFLASKGVSKKWMDDHLEVVF